MFEDNFNGDIWDEHEWESHLEGIEKQHIQLGYTSQSDRIDQILHWLIIYREHTDDMEALDEIIQYEILMDDPYFLGSDEQENDDLWNDELNDFPGEDFPFGEDEDLDAGEEWKELSDNFTSSDYGSIENLSIYNKSRQAASQIMRDAGTLDPDLLTDPYSEFIIQSFTVCAKILAGYSFGFHPEFMGANIAYTKKALLCANHSLAILHDELKKSSVINKKSYFSYHKQLFELRNDIGIYIQELREQFRSNL